MNGKVFLKGLGIHVYVNGVQVQQGETLELAHLDRVVFGWNSVFLFKNKDPTVPIPDKYLGKFIDWWFIKSELMHLVDIDESDSEDGGGSCCQIYWFALRIKKKVYNMILKNYILIFSKKNF